MYWDDAFDEVLYETTGVRRELVASREEGGIIIRRLRFVPDRDLPAPAASLLGTKRLTYEQENRFDPARDELAWKVLPTVLPGRLSAQGRFRIEELPGGCEQVIEGEIVVSVPLVGGQIEKAVVAEVERSYARTAVAARQWIADQNP